MVKKTDGSLTPTQKKALDWILAYREEHGKSPSIRDIMRGLNLSSPAPVQASLERLKSKGYVDWKAGATRGIVILRTADQTDSPN